MGIPVSSTNKTYHHGIAEILLKVHGVKYHNPNPQIYSRQQVIN
jgi:hypothetical protein